jgi:hypothetical protein
VSERERVPRVTLQGPRPLRVLVRTRDGLMRDPESGDAVSLAEFHARLQAGERLRVRHETTGADCTIDTLLQLISVCLPLQHGLSGEPEGGTPA